MNLDGQIVISEEAQMTEMFSIHELEQVNCLLWVGPTDLIVSYEKTGVVELLAMQMNNLLRVDLDGLIVCYLWILMG